ncbi:asparaginase, putative [Ixodes scapularis]|uniref:Asparaginase, putative n=1 Tax=Ixodes scapularis TaxID=6945 RepID=B7QGF3_IXOSC|nr:asparaginase, putative [Ixodes scapularis]|eukprot:XP_002401537.1 asparaginase, putative [Ixodes scapularis]
MDDWICIAQDIELNYKDFDGFVILHGTDTMAYTASALSFVFENLGKPVIITGSQIPVFEPRSDGRENLLNALIIAGNYAIPEVGLMFHNQLFRGNRTSKFSIDQLDAFASFNLRPLATIGINIEIEWNLLESRHLLDPAAPKLFRAHDRLNRNVGLLRFFPSITLEVVSILGKQVPSCGNGVIFSCYLTGLVTFFSLRKAPYFETFTKKLCSLFDNSCNIAMLRTILKRNLYNRSPARGRRDSRIGHDARSCVDEAQLRSVQDGVDARNQKEVDSSFLVCSPVFVLPKCNELKALREGPVLVILTCNILKYFLH